MHKAMQQALHAYRKRTVAGLSKPGIATLERIGTMLHDQAQDASPWMVLAQMLLNHTRILADLSTSSTTRTLRPKMHHQ